MTEALDKVDIEKYLASATAAVIEQHQKAVPANICAKLVERINAELHGQEYQEPDAYFDRTLPQVTR